VVEVEILGQVGDHCLSASPGREHAQQPGYQLAVLDLREAGHIPQHDGAQIPLEPALPQGRAVDAQNLRVAARADQSQVVRPGPRRLGGTGEGLPSGEQQLAELAQSAEPLGGGERPQLDEHGSTGQRLRQRGHGEEAGGAGQHELTLAVVAINQILDRQHQLVTATLDLVDDPGCGAVAGELAGIFPSHPERGRVVQRPERSTMIVVEHVQQRRLPGLPRTIDDDHPKRRDAFAQALQRKPRNNRSHASTLSAILVPD
jgi:hypothetical protein